MSSSAQEKSVRQRLVDQVREKRDGMTYSELRKAVPQPSRDEFNREVVQAMRTGSITIRAGRYVVDRD